MIKDTQLILVGRIRCIKFEKKQRVYSAEGISPTVASGDRGNIKIEVKDDR